MTTPDGQDAALIGTVLGEAYRLTRLIGRGGMGAVYEGQHLRLSKRVAVKLMAPELAAHGEAMARFRREAEVTSQLGHPHIVQVFDFGVSKAGAPYLVMEYLEGEDLDQRLRRVGRFTLPAAAAIIKQVASALAATHGKGIVHRDLKPANIFLVTVDDADFVKVVDFGISKVRTATTKLTAAAVVMGTPNYMAPEQATGRVDEIDHRTDQWALGCIAYELLAGRPPFVGENVASLLYQVVHQAPSPLAANAPEVTPAVEAVLASALAKRMDDRFPSMTAFARAFEGAAAGRPVTVPAAAAPALAAPAPPPAPDPERREAVAMALQATTFSAVAGEAAAPERSAPAPRKSRRFLAAAAVAAALIGGGMLLAARRRSPPPAAEPRFSGAPPTIAAPVAAPAPAPAPARAEPAPAPARDAEAPQAAKKEKPRRDKRRSAAAPAWPIAEPAAPARAPGRSPGEAAPIAPVIQAPPPPPAAAEAEPTYRPAWPPPADVSPPSEKPKKKGLFRRIFRGGE